MTDVVSLFRLDSGQVMHKQLKLDLDGLACERMVAVHDDGRRREFDDSDLAPLARFLADGGESLSDLQNDV